MELYKASQVAADNWSRGVLSDCHGLLHEVQWSTAWSFLTPMHCQHVRLLIVSSLSYLCGVLVCVLFILLLKILLIYYYNSMFSMFWKILYIFHLLYYATFCAIFSSYSFFYNASLQIVKPV